MKYVSHSWCSNVVVAWINMAFSNEKFSTIKFAKRKENQNCYTNRERAIISNELSVKCRHHNKNF